MFTSATQAGSALLWAEHERVGGVVGARMEMCPCQVRGIGDEAAEAEDVELLVPRENER